MPLMSMSCLKITLIGLCSGFLRPVSPTYFQNNHQVKIADITCNTVNDSYVGGTPYGIKESGFKTTTKSCKILPLCPHARFPQEFSSSEPLRIGYYTDDLCTRTTPPVHRAIFEAKKHLEQNGHKVSETS